MFIAKIALPRRTFLRGLGASLALPLLDAMVPALSPVVKTAANPVRRLGFVYIPNGVAMNAAVNYWLPKGEGASFELSPVLTPLAAHRDRMIVVSGLAHAQAESMGDGQGDHSRASAGWLSGVHAKQTEGADVRAGTTLDQVAADQLGNDTQLGSLELAVDPNFLVGNCENGYSCVYINTLSWRTATTPLPTENNPRVVFERLFGDGGTAQQRLIHGQRVRSILDSVTDDLAQLERSLGPSDHTRLDEYLEAVREIERRIQKAEAKSSVDSTLPTLERPVGIPDTFGDHLKLMYDLQWLAYRADVTRVVTLMLGRELVGRAYPELGVPESHHGLSHHRDDPENLAKLAKINTYHVQLFAYFVDKLRATPDGDGTLLDHVILLYGAGLSNPNEHAHTNLPLLVVGGAGQLKGGRHLQYPKGTPMMNLLLALLDRVGVRVDHYGDSTGRVVLEPLAGV